MTGPEVDGWGIQAGYHDVWGGWKEPGPEVTTALRRAMGAAEDDPAATPPDGPRFLTAPAGRTQEVGVDEPGWLTLEDGTQVHVRHHLPAELPLGVHRFEGERGRSAPNVAHVLVRPGTAARPPSGRRWGITAQLYAARSRASWGVGDLGDLARLARWARAQGASTIGLNPLHAPSPGGPPPNSPYSPSTRRWHDPLYLDVPALLAADPGAADELGERPEATAARLRLPRIDRGASWAAKRDALEVLWARQRSRRPAGLDAYEAEHGAALRLWATYGALAEQHGPSWHRWPAALQRATTPEVGRFADDHADRVAFWSWVQWLVDEQLAASGAAELVVTDLAVGFAPDGFDAWQWQDLLAPGCRIGAPPDLLGPDGQDWGLPPFVPWKLRAVGYRPLLDTLHANLRHTAGLRIDHVMGLLRLFWIPPDHGATEGAYVAWPGTELVDLVATASAQAGSFVVGEDLGTVEPGVRELLRDRGLLSTRLLWFEDEPPDAWPEQAMAAITTHDLPTIAGVWTGVDLAGQRAAGVTVPADGDEAFRDRLRRAASCDDAAPVDEVAVGAHARLAQAPSVLATAALDDLVGAEHRPNVPGTIDEHPNWRIPLPVPLDELAELPLARRIADSLRSARPLDGGDRGH
ncbi:MAG: 4-alpha-glucanotransferase [Acidimicrobiales bacterium]|nr:4-alpha-glucanotransferase [Acidimicrobiales bacterium]HRW37221.1 4-alpha-glucanotransferase [Aquihabitans sp.]